MGKQKSSWEKRREKINQATERMDEAINEYFTTPEQLGEYLQFMTKFYQYSHRNAALIQNQFRGAEAVGSFKFWKEKGFPVQKGEKGIVILVPNRTAHRFKDTEGTWKNIKHATEKEKNLIRKGDLEERKSRLYFTIGHVFDVSQTRATANDLPEIFPSRWLEGDVKNYDVVMESLKGIANDLNVTVGDPLGELGTAKGAFYQRVENRESIGHIGLNPRNGQLQNVKTMIHELAHAKLHHGNKRFKLTDAEKEFQAEMVAYSVASYFGIDTEDYSLNYLANWSKDKKLEDKTNLLNEVKDVSVQFVEKIEKDLIQERDFGKEVLKDKYVEIVFNTDEPVDEDWFADIYLHDEQEENSVSLSIWYDRKTDWKYLCPLEPMSKEEMKLALLDDENDMNDYRTMMSLDDLFKEEQLDQIERFYNKERSESLIFIQDELGFNIAEWVEDEALLEKVEEEVEKERRQQKGVELEV